MPTEDEKMDIPGRPADKTKWWIEDNRLCIPNPDGLTVTYRTQERVTSVLHDYQAALDKIHDLELEINRCQPDRFLPELLKKLELFAESAMITDDRERAEVYAMASVMIRRFLKEDDERDRKGYR